MSLQQLKHEVARLLGFWKATWKPSDFPHGITRQQLTSLTFVSRNLEPVRTSPAID